MEKKKIYNILFIVLVIIILILKIINWPTTLQEMNCDEAMTAIDAKELAETGRDHNGIQNPVYLLGWGGQSVILVYLMALCIKIFGYSTFAIRLPMLVVSIVAIFVFYDLVKRMTKNKTIAKIGLIAVLIMPWQMLQSLWALDCNMFPHFLLFAMYFLYRGVSEKKNWILYISMIFFALSLYGYGIAIYFVPIFLVITAIYLMVKKYINIKQLIICIIAFLAFAWPIITMFAINLFKTNESIQIFGFTIPFYETLSRTQDMLFFSDNILHQLWNNIVSTVSVIIGQYDGCAWNESPVFGTIYHISIIFIIFAIVDIIRKIIKKEIEPENKFAVYLMISWFGIGVLTGILINNANVNRLNLIWYVMVLLTIYGICAIYTKVKNKKAYKAIIIAIYAILFISYIIYFNVYFAKQVDNSICFSRGLIVGLNYIDTLEGKEDFTYTNIVGDQTINIYIRDRKNRTGKEYKCVTDQTELENIIENIDNQDAIIAKTDEIKDVEGIENLQVKEFGEYSVITK